MDELKSAVVCLSVDPSIGGLLLLGSKGTGKSTIVRAFAELLPEIEVVSDCVYSCDPKEPEFLCEDCRRRSVSGEKLSTERRKMRIVELPIGATDDRVVGSINVERTLKDGRTHFEPGLLAQANRNILYVDEVNLLPDHIVDLILDAAAFGWNVVEREGVSLKHPARFILIGTMNPEEGELRPQLLDRFALSVRLQTVYDPGVRAEIVKRNIQLESDTMRFTFKWAEEQERLKTKMVNARRILGDVEISDAMINIISTVCGRLAADGYRPDIVAAKVARTRSALDGRREVTYYDSEWGLQVALSHRTRAGGLKPPPTSDELAKAFQEARNLFSPAASRPDVQGSTSGEQKTESPTFSGPEDQGKRKRKWTWQAAKSEDVAAGGGVRRRRRFRPPRLVSYGIMLTAILLLSRYYPLLSFLLLYLLFVAWLANRLRKKPSRYGVTASPQTDAGSASKSPSLLALIIPRRGIGRPQRHLVTKGRRLVESVQEEPVFGPRLQLAKILQKSRWLGRRKAPRGQGHAVASGLDRTTLDVSFSATIRAAARRGRPLRITYEDVRTIIREGKARASLVMVLDSSESMIDSLSRVREAIRAVRRESQRKRDRVSLVVFKGEEAFVIQYPTTNFNLVLQKLQNVGLSDFTPLASGMMKGARLALAEKARGYIPIEVIVSDGATNVGIPRINARYADLPDPLADAIHVAKVLQSNRTSSLVVNMHHAPLGQSAPVDLLIGTELMQQIAKISRGVYIGFDHYTGEQVTADLSLPHIDADLMLKR